MKNYLLPSITGTLLTIILLTAGCNQPHDTTSNSGPKRESLPTPGTNANASPMHSNSNTPEDSFAAEAASGGMMEVELGRLAQTKAQNAEVKQFGQMMVTDHTKANDELKALAAKKGVTLPASPIAKHQEMIDELKGKSGAEFDRAYVDDMLDDHEKDVAEFEKQSRENSDAEVKAFAAKTLPTLKKHLEAIKAIQAKLK